MGVAISNYVWNIESLTYLRKTIIHLKPLSLNLKDNYNSCNNKAYITLALIFLNRDN